MKSSWKTLGGGVALAALLLGGVACDGGDAGGGGGIGGLGGGLGKLFSNAAIGGGTNGGGADAGGTDGGATGGDTGGGSGGSCSSVCSQIISCVQSSCPAIELDDVDVAELVGDCTSECVDAGLTADELGEIGSLSCGDLWSALVQAEPGLESECSGSYDEGGY